MLFVETSAKTAANTSELFEMVAKKLSNSMGSNEAPAPSALPSKSAAGPA